jgi:cytochrome P450 family 135
MQTAGFLLAPVQFTNAARRRYGDVVWFRTYMDPGFAMVFEPGLVKQVMQAPPDRLRAGEANALLEPIVGSRSVLLLDGAEHLRHRRLMLPSFHGQRLKTYEDLIRRAADREIDAWPADAEFELLPSMQSLTLDVIMGAVFGVGEGEQREELKHRVRATLKPITTNRRALLFVLLRGRDTEGMQEFATAREALDRMLFEEIAARREAPDLQERADVLSLLLLARDEEDEPLSDAEVRDELLTMLVAGHETTATGLAWAFDLILHTPRVRDRLLSDLDDITYLDAVIKENLRLRPVIPGIGRVVHGGPFPLNGHAIPEGAEINPSIAVVHRRADRYPDPQAFRPERFLGDDAPDTYTWIPFGGGTRRCIGANFAQFEMRIVIARVLDRVTLRPADPKPERLVRRAITQVPKNGVRVRLDQPASARVGTSPHSRSSA